MRESDKTKVYLRLYFFSQLVTVNELNHNLFLAVKLKIKD